MSCPGILAGLRDDDVAVNFRELVGGRSNECEEKKEEEINKTRKGNGRRNAEEFDLRRGAMRAATAGSIIVTKTSRGRARAAAG